MVTAEWRNNLIVLIILGMASIFIVISLYITSLITLKTAHDIEAIVNGTAKNVTDPSTILTKSVTQDIEESKNDSAEDRQNVSLAFEAFKQDVKELIKNYTVSLHLNNTSLLS